MRTFLQITMLAPVLLAAAYGQTPGKAQFEVASIKANAPQPGFHFASDAASGGPGTADPGMFRCTKCTLATLIVKAFNLQPYQFPGRASLTGNTYDIQAKIPAGATSEDFSAMLQNLLSDRFGLQWHFDEKRMKGYRLVIAKNGSKLKESTGASLAPGGHEYAAGQGDAHSHTGAVIFGTSASYRASNQTIAELARVLSDQISAPVDDETGLAGRYDILLRWSGTGAPHAGLHSDGGFAGGSGHAGHESGSGAPSGPAPDPPGPALFDALQQQLGLRLVSAEQTTARLFVVDRVAQRPTEN